MPRADGRVPDPRAAEPARYPRCRALGLNYPRAILC